MVNAELLKERRDRILKAVALEKPDRIPMVLEYSGFAAYATKTEMADFISSPSKATETMIVAYKLIGGGDAINYGTFSPYRLSYIYGAKVKVPGIDLPPDGMWQVVETELMKVEDYDRILEIGWPEFFKGFLSDRVFNDAAWNLLPANQDKVDIIGLWSDVGVPVLTGGNVTTPFELLCGSRSTEKFFLDLLEIPDKVEAVMELMIPHLALTNVDRMINHGYMVAWVGGWRTAPFMLSPRIWERFVWPYFQQQVNKVVEAGLIPLLHLDSNWDRELERFKNFPKVVYVSYKPAAAAITALTRQPFFGPKILNLMLITLSLLQTPIIFGFIISYFIFSQSSNATTLVEAMRFLSSGFCIGIGTIGPSIGLATFAEAACSSIGINRTVYKKVLSFTFLSEAIIETPIIFALLTSMVLVTIPIQAGDQMIQSVALFSAALSTGVSTIATGISSGKTAATACMQIAFKPKHYNTLSKTSMIAQGLLDTFPIYGLIVSLMLIFII